MVKRLFMVIIAVSLLVGSATVATATQHDFATRGSHGHPFRIIGFVLFPVGLIMDYAFFRPVSYLACKAPDLTGCTPHDQRALGMGGGLDEEFPSEETE
ncbi:MAG: hypothetical protein ACE5IQ_06795 [Candidatus Methylomirabilales bacterium]